MRFPLTSDQLELLLAFEECDGLASLSERMAKDSSVISRNLQRIAESSAALVKVKNRWELTSIGRQLNAITREYLKSANGLASSQAKEEPAPYLAMDATLVIINAQNGLFASANRKRNNDQAELKIEKLLKRWRETRRPVVHVKHMSENPESLFYKNSPNSDFIPPLRPLEGETVVEKPKANAFSDTNLSDLLLAKGLSTLVLTGFTANECIDTTARSASELGFLTYVVGDATAMFDLADPSGGILSAERVHALVLANLNALYAKVISTEALL